MSPRQRFIAAIQFKAPDKVPCEVRFTKDMQAEMVAYTGEISFMDKYIEPAIVRLDLEEPGEWIKPGFYRDVFGVIWNRTVDKNIGVVENIQITPENIKSYHFPDPLPDAIVSTLAAAAGADQRGYRLGRLNLSFWERAWTLRGMENLMMDLAVNPDLAHDLFSRICDYNCRVLERALKSISLDGVHFGDDWGTQCGLQMSPRMWRTFIKPHIKRMYALVRDAGKYVSIHSCGRVQELFDEFIQLGVNTFNPFQPEVIDVDSIFEQYKGRLCFWGGISTQRTLPFGSPAETYDETKHLLNMGRNGGMIVSPAHSIPPGCKPENILAMLDAMRDHYQTNYIPCFRQ
jgi:uroporphyrinogen decarboxylase